MGLSGSKSALKILQNVEPLVKKSFNFIVPHISIERCFHGFLFFFFMDSL